MAEYLNLSCYFSYKKIQIVIAKHLNIVFFISAANCKTWCLSWSVPFLKVGCWAVQWTVRESNRTASICLFNKKQANSVFNSLFQGASITSTLTRICNSKYSVWFQRKLLALNLECSIFISINGYEFCNTCSVVSGVPDTYCC